MKAIRLLLAAIVSLALCCCASRPEHGIKLDAQHFDLGTVYLNDAVKHIDVGFTNTGRQDLVISDVKTDCDCTTATFSPEPVSSGDKGEIHIQVDLTKFFPQEIQKRVAVYSNATKEPMMIDIKGIVKRNE